MSTPRSKHEPPIIDFTDERRRKRFFEAKKLITDGFRILRDEVGVDNPADNAFLREATVCAKENLKWVGERGGTDARRASNGDSAADAAADAEINAESVTGEEIEIKSTRLDNRTSISFPTSRYVSQTVIDRFRAADWFAFAIFDLYEELVALYRVDKPKMKPLIDALEREMLKRQQTGKPYNNPHWPFSLIRPMATLLYFDVDHFEERHVGQAWTIIPRGDAAIGIFSLDV